LLSAATADAAKHKDSTLGGCPKQDHSTSKNVAKRKEAEDVLQYCSGKRVLKLPVLFGLHQSLSPPWVYLIQKYPKEQNNPPPFDCLPR